MEYRAVIFDKDAYLRHHGVKGQKWGVHNDETKRKYGELAGGVPAGGGSADDDEEKDDEASPAEKAANVVTYGTPDPGDMEKPKSAGEALENLVINAGRSAADAIKKAWDTHVSDIKSGDIERGEAQVIGVLNAVKQAATGSNLVDNPKAGEMGVKYGQGEKAAEKVAEKEEEARKWRAS